MSGKLKEIKDRMASIGTTQKMTKAMKLISAIKFKKSKDAILRFRPFESRLHRLAVHLIEDLGKTESPHLGLSTPSIKPCLVVLTSDKGLCGAYNHAVIQEAVHFLETNFGVLLRQNQVTIYCIGKVGFKFFKKNYGGSEIIEEYIDLATREAPESIFSFTAHLIEQFDKGLFDSIQVAYNRYKNPAVQYPEVKCWLPIRMDSLDRASNGHHADYLFEPDKEKVLKDLVPFILQTAMQRYFLDAIASENGSRMSAMDQATKNAEKLIKKLELQYNKARQANITNEILEIINGSEALKKD